MAWKVRDGGAWHDVSHPTVVVNGEQRTVVRGLVRVGGTWRRFYPESEVTSTAITGGLTGTVETGVAKTVTGTVTAVSGSISGGTVTVFQRQDASSPWVAVGTATPTTGAIATWSASVTPSLCSATEFKAVYSGTATYEGSESAPQAVQVIVRAPVKPTGGTLTTTTAALSWAATAGATGYEVYRNGSLVGSPTSPSFTDTGLTPGTTYSWTVVAKYGTCSSAPSPAKQGTTGRDEVRDTGSMTIQVDPYLTDSYRPDVGWGYIDANVGQGYFSDSGRNYTGVIDYGGATVMRDKCIAALGAAGRFDNGTVTGARVYLFKRTGVGAGGAVTASFYRSAVAAGAGSSVPARLGTKVDVATTSSGAGKWYDIGVAHGLGIAKPTDGSRSIVLYNASTANYLQMTGKSAGDHCDMQMDWTWDYVSQTAVPPSWTP